MKILRVDAGPTYHALFYEVVEKMPSIDDVPGLTVWMYHAPLAGFEDVLNIGAMPVVESELIGFHEYLKQTDFKRYATETNQSIDELLTKANSSMAAGNAFKDSGDALMAIEKYTEALECFPLYFEALDNRAFARMDLGIWDEAIEDFRESERVNGPTMLTVFSIGECHLKAGRFEEARGQFAKCIELEPNNSDVRRFLQMAIDGMKPEK